MKMGKNNEKLWKLTRILGPIVVLIIAVVGAVYGYGKLNEKVYTNSKNIINNEAASLVHEVRLDDHDKIMIGQGKDIIYIRKAVDRIESKLDADRTGKNRVE